MDNLCKISRCQVALRNIICVLLNFECYELVHIKLVIGYIYKCCVALKS